MVITNECRDKTSCFAEHEPNNGEGFDCVIAKLSINSDEKIIQQESCFDGRPYLCSKDPSGNIFFSWKSLI